MIVLNAQTFCFERKIPYQIAARNTLQRARLPGAGVGRAQPAVRHLSLTPNKSKLIVAYSDASLHVLDVNAHQAKLYFIAQHSSIAQRPRGMHTQIQAKKSVPDSVTYCLLTAHTSVLAPPPTAR